jgi:hypothetical protein
MFVISLTPREWVHGIYLYCHVCHLTDWEWNRYIPWIHSSSVIWHYRYIPWMHSPSVRWHYRYIPWINSMSVRWQTYDITDTYHEFIPSQWDDKHMTLQIYTMNSFPFSEMTNLTIQIYTMNSFHQWDDKHMTLQIYTMNSFPVERDIWFKVQIDKKELC